MNRTLWSSIVLAVLGLGFLIGGSLLIASSQTLIRRAVDKECQLKPGTVAYKLWRDSPVPFHISIYVFDLVNEIEFLRGGKPHLIQRGPFVYKEQRTKNNVTFYSNGTVSYRESRNFTFDRSLSSDDETLVITTVNVVYMTLINYLQMENIPSLARKILGTALSLTQETPIMKRTVKEYLWGYEDPLLSGLKAILPDLVPNDQISIFAAAVDEAQYETVLIDDGVKDIKQLGHIERFNFSANLSIWSNEYANMINGTDSTLWHPDASKDELIYAFMNDICRSVHLTFNQTYENTFNIETYRYTLPKDLFANSSADGGFCLLDQKQNLKCLPNGLFSLSPCIHLSGSKLSIPLPIIASNPHFLDADRSVQVAIEGLAPDENLHRSYADIEPITGIVMNGTRRMQFNINVINDSAIAAVANISSLVYPMIWVNEHAEIDQPNANMFHKKVSVPIKVLAVLKYILLTVGILLLLITVIGFALYKRPQSSILVTEVPVTTTDETTPLLE